LCAEAMAQGVSILRDKNAMGLGERISKFMKRIGGADRVFVVLSDKYLKSPFCMFELSEVWRNSRQEDEEFLKRIRVYTLPCARVWNTLDRAKYAIYWKEQYDEVEALVKTHGYDILGEADVQHFRRMKDFCRNVGDILATVADILQPHGLDELVKYGFD
jgi:internalin A